MLPEWKKTLAVLGGEDDVERFLRRATGQLGASLEAAGGAGVGHWKLHVNGLPLTLKSRLEGEGLAGTLRIDFHQPPAPGTLFIHRTHPLVSAVADYLLEKALDDNSYATGETIEAVARAGAIYTNAVTIRTTVLLLRLRHQLSVAHRGHSRLLLCEETVSLALEDGNAPELLDDAIVQRLMTAEPARNMPIPLRDRHLQQALDKLPDWQPMLEGIAQKRAQQLLEDHRRVREAARGSGEYRVTPSLPVDVMGAFVLVPD